MHRLALSVVFLTALVACRLEPSNVGLTEEQQAVISDTLRRIAGRIEEAAFAFNHDQAYTSPFSRDVVWVENGMVMASWDSAKTADMHLLGLLRNAEIEWGDTYVKVLGPQTAVMTAALKVTGTHPTGRVDEIRATNTYVFARTDEGWKIVYGHSSWLPQL